MGLSPLFEELKKSTNINLLLDGHPETRDLIKRILIGDLAEEEFTTINKDKLKNHISSKLFC